MSNPILQDRVIVVGAGVAGLAAALELAARGLDVTVLERAPAPGGKMREVAVGGARIDAGPTVFTMRRVFEELFAAAGADFAAHVTLHPASVLARHAWGPTERLDLYADVDRSADAIGAFAGAAEARGYRAFYEHARRVYRTLDAPFIRAPQPGSPLALVARAGARDLLATAPFATLWRALGEHFKDPRLRQLFGRYATYCGSSPFLAPATLMLIAHVEQDGVWLVEGGMHRLAQAMAALAQARGARFRYGAEVAEITAAAGRATGVRLADGERIAADAVVLNADLAALAGGLFGPAVAGAAPAPGPRSLSAVTWAMTARTSGFPLLRHNVFFSRGYEAEFEDIFRRNRPPGAPTIYVCAQDRGDDDAPLDGPERLLCLMNAPPNGDAQPWTPKETQECAERSFGLLERCGLRLQPGSDDGGAGGGGGDGHHSAGLPPVVPGDGGRAVWPGDARGDGGVPPGRRAQPGAEPILGGGQHASGVGRADGGAVRAAGGGQPARGPRFDAPVAPRGYAWWYVDALSADGLHGLTVIAFLGSVFSPYYAWARRGGGGDPLDHCAVHVSLHGPRGRAWAFTERGRDAVERGAGWLRIGRSALTWDGDALLIELDERTAYLPGRIRGTVRVQPEAMTAHTELLDASGRHRWSPLAPRAAVEVSLSHPDLHWAGDGYFDTNDGDRPLEDDFTTWHWSRAGLRRGAAVFYDVNRRDGGSLAVALRVDPSGAVQAVAPLTPAVLPRSRWGVARHTRADAGFAPSVTRTLLDSPFYARSVLGTRVNGEAVTAMHESLSMDRFRTPWVQAMLPFRVPRALRVG